MLVDRLKRGLSKQALQGVMGSDRQVGRQVGRLVDRLGAARKPGENEKIPWQQQHVSYGSRDFSFFFLSVFIRFIFFRCRPSDKMMVYLIKLVLAAG